MSYGGASPIIDYGIINFVRNRREAKADFLRVGHTVPVHHLLRFLTKQWKLPDPGIIVQVTGSAQGFDLPPNLVTPITEGIVEAASVAEAWIITGGFNVYSIEVENALRAHEAVQDCAVIGLPDDKWGERIVAVVQPRAGQTVDATALAAFVKQQIGSIKTPKQIEVWNDLPRSKVGKVLKPDIRARLA